MSKSQEELAKVLFIEYRGSHFHMERDGKYSLYQSYNISKETEFVWIREYQDNILDNLGDSPEVVTYFLSLCSTISQYYSIDLLPRVIALAESKIGILDTFSTEVMFEAIYRSIVDLRKSYKDSFYTFLKRLYDNLNQLLVHPIIATDESLRITNTTRDNFEDYMIDRIKGYVNAIQTDMTYKE